MAGDDKYPAYAAFDDRIAKIVTTPGSFVYYAGFPAAGIEINYDFGEPTYINRYRMLGSNDAEYTTVPKSWTFEGSNDGDNWTVLDTRTGQTWSSGQVRSYSFQNDDAYVYYKFDCTELNGATDYLMLWEIEFWGTAPGEVPVDLTSPSGTVPSRRPRPATG